ncbi:MAG TPA: CAP domain-containing protein [Bacteriovoracaceae bacterium]|nr:CAP domain-containing protein [Bacteriovoracaceae bacterium]
MKKYILQILAIIAISTNSFALELTSEELETQIKLTEQYMELVNDHRNDIGHGTLTYVNDIEKSAEYHSKRMAIGKVSFSHKGSGNRCSSIKLSMGRGNLCGEIIAWGQKTPERVFKAWLNSPGHKRILEGRRYTHTGMGFAKNSKGRIYWTQIFLEIR